MFKDANIKSKRELAQRLIDGEEFFTSAGWKISFVEEATNPFCHSTIAWNWSNYKDLQIKVDWRTNTPHSGVLCWCGNASLSNNRVIDLIGMVFRENGEYRYQSNTTIYKHVTRLKNKEIAEIFFMEGDDDA